MSSSQGLRFALLAPAGAALAGAVWAGLARFAWPLPAPRFVAAHGALMVCGFLGTLIALERASASGRRWALAAPALAAVGAAAALLGGDPRAAALPWTLAAAALVALLLSFLRLQPSLHGAVLVAGAALWLAGNALWLAGLPLGRVVPWWSGFLVVTIAGERLELTRLRRPGPWSVRLAVAALVLLAVGLSASTLAPAVGLRAFGAALLLLAFWLLTQDVAWRTVRVPGLTRFIALCLLAGYFWLAVGGVLWSAFGPRATGMVHDAALHAVFVGFVLSMIFGHAPVIMPGVLRVSIPFHPVFYGHLALLHVSLLMRVGGDLAGAYGLARWGALLNAVAVLAFLANTVAAVRRGAAGDAPGRRLHGS